MARFSKKNFFVGLGLIIVSFFCVMVMFYFLLDEHRMKIVQADRLQEQVEVLSTEKEIAQKKVSELEQEAGQSISLGSLLQESQRLYGREEKPRSEGYLWINRSEKVYIVTLGALNGLTVGSRLAVYDGEERIGFVRVDTALDVISYVRPSGTELSKFADNYYRVVVDK